MRYALSGAIAASLLGSAALAGPDKVQFPEGYQGEFTHYSTVNRTDERRQVVKIFANDVALASAKDGAPLDSGSVLVMEVYKAKLDADENPVVGGDGFFETGDMAAIAVMESRTGWGAEYPEEIRNGSWEYALFDAKEHTLMDRDHQPCFECHKPLHEADYVFPFDALTETRQLRRRMPPGLPAGRRPPAVSPPKRLAGRQGRQVRRLDRAHSLEPGGALD